MGHGHGHGHGADGSAVVAPPVARRCVVALAVAVALLSAVGAVVLWPSGSGRPHPPVASDGSSVVDALVVSVRQRTCEGSSSDRRADGSVPARVQCPRARVRLTSGSAAGDVVPVDVPAPVAAGGLSAGAAVRLSAYPDDGSGEGPAYAWLDYSRAVPLAVVVAVFALVVAVVGRRRGLASLVGLALGYAGVLCFIIPAVVAGEPPTLVALVGSVGTMTGTLYLAHGLSLRTAVAHLGTTTGLVLTAAVAPLTVHSLHLTGMDDADAQNLATATGAVDLSGLVLAGVVIAALGVLNDVTITQASAVWELRQAAARATFGDLFARGMRIGRDHLASSVYTLAFAYAGAALPALVLLYVYAAPASLVVSSGAVAEEVARTAVGGACLVAAIPLTTAIAAATVVRSTVHVPEVDDAHDAHDAHDAVADLPRARGRHAAT